MTLPFFELGFDAHGDALHAAQLDPLLAECKASAVTDVIFLAHGFRCGKADANALYSGLMTNLSPRLPANGKFAVAGVYWPAQRFAESFGTGESWWGNSSRGNSSRGNSSRGNLTALRDNLSTSRSAQDEFVASVLSRFDNGHDDPMEGVPLLHQFRGSELLERLRPISAPLVNGVDRFLNFMSWSAMKQLAGTVGAKGLAASVLACRNETGATRIHLVGHSLGGRLTASCCKALAGKGAGRVDSLSLLEAAFSHFGFSPDAGQGQRGFFREVIESRIVRGPIISTFSKLDQVVGRAYAVVSRLANDRLQAIGDAADPYGGIGYNGAQRTPESLAAPLHCAGEPYAFERGIVACLDGSAGLITSHGDVENVHVTYLIASAIGSAVDAYG